MTIEKLLKCLELTRSDQDGEALAAIRKANTIRNTLGKTWGELFSPPTPGAAHSQKPQQGEFDFSGYPDIDDMLYELERVKLTERAEEFVEGLRDFYFARSYLTDKQHAALCRTYDYAVRNRRAN